MGLSLLLIVLYFNGNSVTRNYFENLVRALENGLSDVDSHGACSRTTSSKSLGGGSSKGRGGRGKGTTSKSSSSSRNIDDSSHWSCEHCTFANVKSATICQICHKRRWTLCPLQNEAPGCGDFGSVSWAGWLWWWTGQVECDGEFSINPSSPKLWTRGESIREIGAGWE